MTESKYASWPLYPRFVLSLLTGHKVALREPADVGQLTRWKAQGLESVIAIASGQLESQRASLDRMLSRAQLLFTTLIALLALLFGVAGGVWASSIPLWGEVIPRFLLVTAIALLTIALLGTAALIAVRKEFDAMSATELSKWASFDKERLAREYAECVGIGEKTNNAHLTVFGTAVRLTLYGTIALGLAWAVGSVF